MKANKSKPVTMATQGEQEIVITRVFDAPRKAVWDANTRPEILKRWMGVRAGWTLDVCEVDLRVGGKYRWVWRGPNREEMGMGGVYREIVPVERLVASERFDHAWYEGEGMNTLLFAEKGGKTTLTMILRYESAAIRDGVAKGPMERGLRESFDMLDGVLS